MTNFSLRTRYDQAKELVQQHFYDAGMAPPKGPPTKKLMDTIMEALRLAHLCGLELHIKVVEAKEQSK